MLDRPKAFVITKTNKQRCGQPDIVDGVPRCWGRFSPLLSYPCYLLVAQRGKQHERGLRSRGSSRFGYWSA